MANLSESHVSTDLTGPMLTVFIMCYNRPEMAREAIASILQQTDNRTKVVVSDNSTRDELESLVAEMPEQGFEFRRRVPSTPAGEHFNRCMDEVDTPYFMLFHDDDLMLPGAISAVLEVIAGHGDVVAVGINAIVERGGVRTGPSFVSFSNLEISRSPSQLFKHYFSKGNVGIAPFPGYAYAARVARTFRFSASEGKYSDVAFLMRVNSLGPIIWISTPLMVYRLHAGNDSNFESRRDRLRFLAFLKKHPDWVDAETLVDYRYFIYKRLARQSSPAVRRIRKNLKLNRALRLPDLSVLSLRLRMRLAGKKKSI